MFNTFQTIFQRVYNSKFLKPGKFHLVAAAVGLVPAMATPVAATVKPIAMAMHHFSVSTGILDPHRHDGQFYRRNGGVVFLL